MSYVLVAAGLSLLLLGGELLVRGAVWLARRLGVSPLIIGLTIVAYGTSAPELLVTLRASLAGAPGIAIGNVVGSNIANILLIVGCSALIFPITCAPGSIKVTGPVVLGSTLLLVLLGLGGAITPWAGIPMLAFLIGFTVFSYQVERQGALAGDPEAALHLKEVEAFEGGSRSLAGGSLALLAGLAGVIAGSHFLVTGAVGLARSFGVSEATIGLTLVAFGTSLPELATAVVAAYRRHSDVALGNVVGSNLFNILGVMGVVPLFGTLPVPPGMAGFDLWVMLGVTVFFIVWIMRCHCVGRVLAAAFLLGYGVYIACHYFGIAALPFAPA
ncbi:MAG: calcium/sodium antiporter [Kiloniellaceae bacterium]